jgi:Uma2 family endonuclease
MGASVGRGQATASRGVHSSHGNTPARKEAACRDGVILKLVDFPLTDARILALSWDNPDYRFERMPTGELHVTPNGGEAGRRNSAQIAQLHAWNVVSERGIVFDSSTGFVLPDRSAYAPDAAWLARDPCDALTPEQREQFLPLCPDAAFEIASPSDRPDVLRTKMHHERGRPGRADRPLCPLRRSLPSGR